MHTSGHIYFLVGESLDLLTDHVNATLVRRIQL